MKQSLLVIFLFLSCWLRVYAQVNDIKFTHISTEQGLSHGTVTCMLQDREGFMWFGTKDGLNRYDGYNFVVFDHNPADTNSISNNVIRSIYEDSNGMLWVGTYIGLSKYNKDTQTFTSYFHNPADPRSISDNNIISIYEDQAGILWIGTYKGLNKYDSKTNTFTLYEHSPNHLDKWLNNTIHAIYEDSKGNLWVGTSKGLSLFDRGKEKFTRFLNTSQPEKNANYPVRAIIEDKTGFLWIGTEGDGLKSFDPATNTFTDYKYNPTNANSINHNAILSLQEDSNGILWIGTKFGGLNKRDPKTGVFTHYAHNSNKFTSISDNTIECIYEDRSHVLWVGAFVGGINKVDLLQKKIVHFKHEATINGSFAYYINSLFADSCGSIWIGNATGLDRLDRNTGSYIHYTYNNSSSENAMDYAVRCIYKDSKGFIWMGVEESFLTKFDPATEKFTSFIPDPKDPKSLPNGLVNTIYEDKRGQLWIGTRFGLAKFNPQTSTFTTYKPSFILTKRFDVIGIIEDSPGKFWIATTDDGLHEFRPETGKFTQYLYKSKKSLRSKTISCIFRDSKGTLWLGLAEGGLIFFDRKTFSFEVEKNAGILAKIIISSIMEDGKGNLWISTRKNGMYKYNPQTKALRNYDVKDGLQGNEFNKGAYCKGITGEMVVGGNNGFNIFHPDSIKDNPHVPQVAISGFKVFDKPRSLTNQITLPYSDNFFSFDFASLSFALPEKNKFAYKLEGIDKRWIQAGNRRYASYTNLEPGKYVFKVKASNHDGVWNEKGTSVKVVILPPLWKRPWAYVFYVLIGLSILYGIWFYSISRERLKNDLKYQQLESEKLQELNQLKSRFFTNVSHEIRTPLTLILSPLEKLISGRVEERKQKEYYQLMYRNGKRLHDLINQLLDLSKIEAGRMKLEVKAGDIMECIRATVFSFNSMAESRQINFSFSCDKEEIVSLFDKDKLEKIIYNLLSNACKFTPAQGQIYVSVKIEPAEEAKQRIVITVEDSGIGIPPEKLDKIFDRFYQVDSSYTREFEGTGIGLSLTKELVELHEGKISVSSKIGEGTTFRVELPVVALTGKEEITAFLNQESKLLKSIPEEEIQQATLSSQIPLLLVVEDNADVRSYIVSTFRDKYRVIEAANGEEGLNLAQETVPDIIISDVMMPKMDGMTLCKKLKTDEKTSHIPVILLTAKSSVESKLEGLETGADDYITKPFHLKEISFRVKNLVEGRKKLRERFSLGVSLSPSEVAVTSTDEKFLQKISSVIEANLSNTEFGVDQLEKEIGMSHIQLYRKLKALTNQAPSELIRDFRLKRAAALLAQNFGNVSEIAYEVGFNNLSYFTKCFREMFGVSPSKYVVSKELKE